MNVPHRRSKPLMAMVAAGLATVLLGLGHSPPVGGKEPASRGNLPDPRVIVEPSGRFLVMPCAGKACAKGRQIIPKTERGHDYAALRQALAKLRTRYGKLPPLGLVPSTRVSWRVVIKSMDAARRQADGKPLFPVIFLMLGRTGGR